MSKQVNLGAIVDEHATNEFVLKDVEAAKLRELAGGSS